MKKLLDSTRLTVYNRILIIVTFLISSYNALAENVRFSNDTLYCNFSYEEVGTLKNKCSSISDLNIIKTIVLSGYISQNDEDFIHTLGKDYSLTNLDMTDLYSIMSYQGLQGCIRIKSVKYSKHWNKTVQLLFQDCSNLSDVTFPDDECSIKEFSSGTFRGCSSLKEITIPKSVTLIESQVFYLCPNLTAIICNSSMPPLAMKESFGDQFSNAEIIIPTGATMNYKTSAGWCLFHNFSENANIFGEDIENGMSDNVYIIGDTLFCDLNENEKGYLRHSVLNITSNLSSIRNAVLNGYLNDNDGSFINALSTTYNLSMIDMTNLRSTFNYYNFQGCDKLTEIRFSRYWNSTGWYLFRDCSNLLKVVFPENYIGDGYIEFESGSFRGCSSLGEIDIPKTVKSIEQQCFYGCNSLKIFRVHATTPPAANEDSFGGQFSNAKLIVPNGTKTDYETSSGWSLFSNIEEGLDNYYSEDKEISENVSVINGTLYSNLSTEEVGRLKATVLSKYGDLNQITSAVLTGYINNDDVNFLNALSSTYNLSSIDFKEMQTSIDGYGFQGCTKLESVIYSKYWNSTGWYLFKDCSSLKNVEFNDENGDNIITSFATGTFRGCTSLVDITIPKGVTEINSQCFYLCNNLKTIKFLGTSLQRIDKNAFGDCHSLETITLPSGLSLIGERCFEGCPNIKEIYSNSITPPVVSESSFEDIYNSATLYVPKGSMADYKSSSVWQKFANIEERDISGVDNIHIENNNSSIHIYNLEGTLVYKLKNGLEKNSLPKGTYIIKNNKTSYKVVIK